MIREPLELALRSASLELSGPGLEVVWVASRSSIEASQPGGRGGRELLARCEIERTDGGLVARQLEHPDAHGRRLERGYSLQFARATLWRRWTDGAELDDDDLGAELVGWTFRLAVERAAAAPASRE
jgi:hypothetical protein